MDKLFFINSLFSFWQACFLGFELAMKFFDWIAPDWWFDTNVDISAVENILHIAGEKIVLREILAFVVMNCSSEWDLYMSFIYKLKIIPPTKKPLLFQLTTNYPLFSKNIFFSVEARRLYYCVLVKFKRRFTSI